MNSLVLSSSADILLLNAAGQFDALLHVAILDQLEDDIALSLIGVETRIGLFVVFLISDHRVLALGHFKICCGTRHTQRIGFRTIGNASLGKRIGVDAHEEVGLVSVGNVGTAVERDEDVGLTRVDHFYVRTIGSQQSPDLQRHLQIDVFFFGKGTDGSGVVTTVSSIEHNGERLVLHFLCFACSHRTETAKQAHQAKENRTFKSVLHD